MSTQKKMSLIKDPKPYKDEWRLTVKLLHSWKQSTSFGGDTLECVLVDESGDKIQASCKKSLMVRVQRYLPIGEWKQQYKMTILTDTMISRSDYLNDSEFLDLASYEEIVNGTCKPNFLIDVMGQVTVLAAVATVQVKGIDTKRVNFHLRDESGNEVACCLWEKYAEQFEKYVEENTADIEICLIRFAKIKEYKGEIQITNAFDASLLFLNPTMKEDVEFRKLLDNSHLPLALLDEKNEKTIMTKVKDDWDVVDVRCISELLHLFEPENCKIICSIEYIDTDWGWFYFGCDRHNRRLTKTGRNASVQMNRSIKPQFYCDVCRAPCSNFSPKFKLHLTIRDDTETCKIMMLDTIAMTIIGCKATELWDGSFAEVIPPMPIQDLVGKSFCFGVKVTTENISNGSDTFKVSEVWSGDYINRIESLSEPLSLNETISSTMSGGEIPMIELSNENSYDEFSTPNVKRKEGDLDQQDMTSTSKKLCPTIVKKEKIVK
ncbi:hypothetical protein Bca52824_023782 [Brassica carinata]|uniref:DUF223 domain-containing protein n=1 Tax=Brassica carinata TaxID=52824 RepID=A0A8X7VJT0_BRACI|nr:hypothetical protein Bca52824_023782 [Brassica carinata]